MNHLKKIVRTGLLFGLLAMLVMACDMGTNPDAGDDDDDNDDGPVAVTGVSLDRSALSLGLGGRAGLTVTVTPESATDKAVTWTSSNTAVAAVTDAGIVRALSVGTAAITVTTADGNKTAACTVTVADPGMLPNLLTLSGVSVVFVQVPAGSFQRDATAANVSTISSDYWMSETQVTQELYQAVMGINQSDLPVDADSGETPNSKPVDKVNWYHAIAFCNKLSLANGKEPVYSVNGVSDWASLAYDAIPSYGVIPTGSNAWDSAAMDRSKNGYRLPTEAEWMWAAMGADKTAQPNTTGYAKAFAGSTGSNSIGDCAWYKVNSPFLRPTTSDSKTHEVGIKDANELGLYDMSGNVDEWCWDWYGAYPAGTLTDYAGPPSGTERIARGGDWYSDASECTVAYRENSRQPWDNWTDGTLGIRLVVKGD
jgi:formylglycine-generating enzyme required for sulfatase activity